MNNIEYLTKDDILFINNSIKKYYNFNIFEKYCIKWSYIESRNVILIFNNFERNIYFFTIYNLLSKDIKLYLTSNNALLKFINCSENISVDYSLYYKDISYIDKNNYIYKNIRKFKYNYNLFKNIKIKKNNIQHEKIYNNNKLYEYNIYNYKNFKGYFTNEIFYKLLYYKIYKQKISNLHVPKNNTYKYEIIFYIYKNILIYI